MLAEFERAGRTGDPAVWAARREAVLARLDRVVRAEAEGPRDVAPALVEHAFGGRSGRPPLELSAGGEVVRLRGRIDRVDASPARLLVIDYKNSRGSGLAEQLDPEAFGETSFQIPAYLARRRARPARPRRASTRPTRCCGAPSGSRRSSSRPAIRSSRRARAPGERAAAVRGRGRAGGRARSGAASSPSRPRTCARCPFGAVCRFEGAAARDEEERP